MRLKQMRMTLGQIKTCNESEKADIAEVIKEIEREEMKIRKQQYKSLKRRIEKLSSEKE